MRDDPIGAVGDDYLDLAHLPPGERTAMQRLRDWLSCHDRAGEWLAVRNPNGWLPWPDIVCLLAGVDPEASQGREVERLAFLPGVPASWGLSDRPGREELEAAVSSHIARVSKMIRLMELKSGVPADLSPVEAIRAARKAKLPVPWLEAAMADPVCRQFLPEEIMPEKGEAPPMTPQQKGAHFRWEGKTSKDEGKAHAAELVSQGHDRQYIAHALENKYGLKHLTLAYAWIAELKIQPKATPRKKRIG